MKISLNCKDYFETGLRLAQWWVEMMQGYSGFVWHESLRVSMKSEAKSTVTGVLIDHPRLQCDLFFLQGKDLLSLHSVKFCAASEGASCHIASWQLVVGKGQYPNFCSYASQHSLQGIAARQADGNRARFVHRSTEGQLRAQA